MKTDNENKTDSLENTWKDGVNGSGEEDLRNLCMHLIGSRRQTSLNALAERYYRFAILGFAMTLTSASFFFAHIFPYPFNQWIACLMMPYFLTGAIMDIYLYRGIRCIDIYRDGVSEVARKVQYYRRRHFQFMAILIPWMLVIIGLMIYSFLPERYMIIALSVGAIAGAGIGIVQFTKFMAEYRDLSSDMQD